MATRIQTQTLHAAYVQDTHAQARWAFCLLLQEFQADGCGLGCLVDSAQRLYSMPPQEARDLVYNLAARGLAEVTEMGQEVWVRRTEKTSALCEFRQPTPHDIARPLERYW